jgi:hypothetical protein
MEKIDQQIELFRERALNSQLYKYTKLGHKITRQIGYLNILFVGSLGFLYFAQ